MPSASKRVRDLERLLKRPSLTDEMKAKLTSELEAMRAANHNNKLSLRERDLATKYHKAKFFERRKATRKIHKIDNQIKHIHEQLQQLEAQQPVAEAKKSKSKAKKSSASPQEQLESELGALNKQREELVGDLAYILYYPKQLKYISLYVAGADEDCDKNKQAKQEARTYALEQWESDKQEGRDLVDHAIKVEYGQAESKAKKSKGGGDSGADSEDEDEEDDSEADQSSAEDENAENISEQDAESEAESEGAKEPQQSGSQDKSMSNSSKKRKAEEMSQDKGKAGGGGKSEKKAPQLVQDPFFVEPVIVSEKSLTDQEKLRSSKLASRANSSGSRRPARKVSLDNVDTSGMNKQELRLLQWKKKQSLKKRRVF